MAIKIEVKNKLLEQLLIEELKKRKYVVNVHHINKCSQELKEEKIDSLEIYGPEEENPEQYKLLKKVVELFGAKDPKDINLFGYDADAYSKEFNKILKPVEIKVTKNNVLEYPLDIDLEDKGFKLKAKVGLEKIYYHPRLHNVLIIPADDELEIVSQIFIKK